MNNIIHKMSTNKPLALSVLSVSILIIGVLLSLFLSETSAQSTPPVPPSWGTYRPNVYVGVRGQFPTSPLFGLLYSSSDWGMQQQIEQIRHDAEERDGVTKYGWLQHNAVDFGVHQVIDKKAFISFNSSFIQPRDASGAPDTTRWLLRVEARSTTQHLKSANNHSINLFWYWAMPDEAQTIKIVNKKSKKGIASHSIELKAELGSKLKPVKINVGAVGPLQHPSMQAEKHAKRRGGGDDSVVLDHTYFAGVKAPAKQEWNAKQITQSLLYKQAQQVMSARMKDREKEQREGKKQSEEPHFIPTLPNHVEPQANIYIFQHVLTLPFTIDIVLQEVDSKSQKEDSSNTDSAAEVGNTQSWFGGDTVSQALDKRSAEFHEQFENKFHLQAKGASAAEVRFGQAMLSNLLGGIGYWYGTQLIEKSEAIPAAQKQAVIEETKPSFLISAVPSRSFFPRGFMWDEGFHELLVSQWHLPKSLQILDSWFGQIQRTGWLPREQILGEEARKRVPQEFQAQKPRVGNPPTLILTLFKILKRIQAEVEAKQVHKSTLQAFTIFLHKWLPALHQHVQWFYRYQSSTERSPAVIDMSGKVQDPSALPISFRWAGRTKDHCLASGLDDYPRAKWIPTIRDKMDGGDPNQQARDTKRGVVASSIGREGHVDLHAWMIVLAQTMAGLCEFVKQYDTSSSADHQYLIDLAKAYNIHATELKRTILQLHWDDKKKSFADYAYKNGTRAFIHHNGYVSFLPMFLGVLSPSSPELLSVLQSLRANTTGIWTPWGLRSLSQHDRLFGSKEDYWRGHIWINMQYLALQALQTYSQHPQATPEIQALALECYTQLRDNVKNNVFKEYQRTGFVWEQYHALDGKGRKSHPFTGWTALTLLIMADQY